MKKIIGLFALTAMLAVGLTACGDDPVTDEYGNICTPYAGGTMIHISHHLNEWVSPDGVHYWVYGEGREASLAPRLLPDGTLVVDDILEAQQP